MRVGDAGIILLLSMPAFVPIIQSLGYDPIAFAILFRMSMQISNLSPPFGPDAPRLKSISPAETACTTSTERPGPSC